MLPIAGSLGFLLVFGLFVAASTVKIAKEYERGVVFRLGRLIKLRGPGLFFIFPLGIDKLRMVDLRVVTLEVPQQVIDAQAAITRVYNCIPLPKTADPAAPAPH